MFGLGGLVFGSFIIVAVDACAMITPRDVNTLDLKKLHGRWHIDHFFGCDGETGKVEEIDLNNKLKCALLITADDKMSIEIEGVKFLEWMIEYNLEKTPIWIDLTPKSPKEVTEKMQRKGLLELKGDNLTIHFCTRTSDARPSDFKQRKGLRSLLMVCKRAK